MRLYHKRIVLLKRFNAGSEHSRLRFLVVSINQPRYHLMLRDRGRCISYVILGACMNCQHHYPALRV
jgi:hypothetical protein